MAQTEARNGRFIYRDALFVEVEGDKRHARASPAELKGLLLPKGANADPSFRDQVGHYYQAQLIHYGLPFTKDKRGAKLRLIEAINSKTLQVPTNVRNIEADLKKQYTAEIRKKKSVMKQNSNSNTPVVNRKRKASDNNSTTRRSSGTKVSIKIGDVVVDVDHSSTLPDSSAKRRRRATSDESDTGKSVPKRNVQGPRSSPLTASRMSNSALITRSPGSTPRNQKTSVKTNSKTTQDVNRSRSTTSPDTPPPAYSLYNDDYDICHRQPSQIRNDVIQISGSYVLNILNMRTDGYGSMRLHLSHPRDQMWGTFTIGDQVGVLRFDDIADIGQGVQKALGWRAEYTPSGRLKFGKGCDGRIQFDGNGGTQGCFNGLMFGQDIAFEGVLEEGFGHHSEDQREYDIADLMQQWDDFPVRAYRR